MDLSQFSLKREKYFDHFRLKGKILRIMSETEYNKISDYPPCSRGLSSSRPLSLAPGNGKRRDPGNKVDGL